MTGVANSILIEPANGQQRVREFVAEAAITPGHLVMKTAATPGNVEVHGSADLNAQRTFALENIADAGGIADAYAADDRVRVLYAQPGDLINALMGITTITNGDPLGSAGDGTLITLTAAIATDMTERDGVVAYAAETIVNAAGVVRVKVEVA